MEFLLAKAQQSHIIQTYLLREETGCSARVRSRSTAGHTVYTCTVKKRISDMTRIEDEREISREEYEKLLLQADPHRQVIEKQRFVYEYMGQCFEIDVFPFWTDRALMEIELEKEDEAVLFPPEIEIVRELTGDKRYTNAAIARSIPDEQI